MARVVRLLHEPASSFLTAGPSSAGKGFAHEEGSGVLALLLPAVRGKLCIDPAGAADRYRDAHGYLDFH